MSPSPASNLMVPGEMRLRSGRTPTVHDYVRAFLTQMRADLKRSTVFTSAGRTVVHSTGERRIVAPDGTALRVLEHPEGGNQVEHGDHLHAHVRARPATSPVAIPRHLTGALVHGNRNRS